MTKKAVSLLSGGLDSTVLAYHFKQLGYEVHLLSFDYGQRHKRELEFARKTALTLGCRHDVVDLTSVTALLGTSSLTNSSIDVPEGHYAEENMKITVVPNRNAIMLSIAYGVAVAEDARVVAAAVHSGDHFVYPDCRNVFINALEKALALGNEGFGNPALTVHTPFSSLSKADIVRAGARLNVPFEATWSCYAGDKIHCGACGTCVERIEAFRIAGVKDPTEYSPEGLKKYGELLLEKKVK